MEVLTLPIWKTSTWLTLPSIVLDVTTFRRLDEMGLDVVGQHLEATRAASACRVLEPDRWCHRHGCEGTPRDWVLRRLAHEPLGWRPTTLLVTIRRYQCTGCEHVRRQDTGRDAAPRGGAVASWRAVGVESHGVSAPDGGPRRQVPRRLLAHPRQHSPRRGPPGAHNDPRRSVGARGPGSTSTSGATPAAATSTSP